ncbi:Glycine cleavage system transcriptional activator [Rhizobium rhizogenes]|uniref:HTH-type transcriptional regulator TtuA n=2 Tax=Rhizobium/Agrobacterium group TaxID=227290 RepID=A0A546XZB2_AGRTU|nr:MULTISPECIES: transcriptional regulator GcvA [Rhizobium/Agrobacterium group]AQS61289.1 transcriptional regulator GcvA [Rhizobium rhizogenes]MCZ7444051.1 transcriptional regulator GcvA [Rhizobium rhizogenes]NSZ79533.1 transcriptional regulator GcvA [Agrobacterium tumefaciens]OAM63682.1 transcriptional regulator [Rhizobium rhizogenes]TRB06084.1 transcriptional regulator GcvA [Agrobacterium tumefaciens]
MATELPSLKGLQAFEAAARYRSVTLASNELNVTPGAVSLQIRELETRLGVQLFFRKPRSIQLTREGERYYGALRTAFRMMREATAELTARSEITVLTLSCTPTFAIQWLMPRLPAFQQQHPYVDVRISVTNRLVDFSRDDVDLAVRHGFGRYEGLESIRFIDDSTLPVCSPQLLEKYGPLQEAGDLKAVPLLHDENRNEWRRWLEAAGASDVDASGGTVFIDSNGALDAAKAGHGIALTRRSLVSHELAEGALIAPFGKDMASTLAYFLVYPRRMLDNPDLVTLIEWMLSQARSAEAGSL